MDFLSNIEAQLIKECYVNKYGFDFKGFHAEKCRVGKNEIFLVNTINQCNRVLFSDSKSESFKIVVKDGLVYLLGDKSCYPCSNVVESAYGNGSNWVQCFVLPNGNQILGETDIRKSAIIVSFFTEIVAIIEDEKTFFTFIEDLKETFSKCEWFKQIYSVSDYFKIVKFWNYNEKIEKLFIYGLLYPLELVIYSLYKETKPNTDSFVRYFIRSLAESTNKIFNQNEIYDFINSLSSKDIELLLAVDIVRDNVRIDVLDDNYFADLLSIDSSSRYPMFINDKYYIYYIQDRVDDFFLTPLFRRNYLALLKRNFRELENQLRKGKGFDNVGTYFMEKLVFNKLNQTFPDLTIIAQHSPNWLSPQRFDIFVKECNLAVEYNGIQHFQPISFFGGEDGFRIIQVLDERKRDKCKTNATSLFEIRFDDDFDLIFANLEGEVYKRLNE